MWIKKGELSTAIDIIVMNPIQSVLHQSAAVARGCRQIVDRYNRRLPVH